MLTKLNEKSSFSYELVRAQGIRIRVPWSLLRWTDPITRIIAVRETSTWNPDYRHHDLPRVLVGGFAPSIHTRRTGLLSHPDAVVEHTTQFLREVPIDIRRYRAQRLVREDFPKAIRRSRALLPASCTRIGLRPP